MLKGSTSSDKQTKKDSKVIDKVVKTVLVEKKHKNINNVTITEQKTILQECIDEIKKNKYSIYGTNYILFESTSEVALKESYNEYKKDNNLLKGIVTDCKRNTIVKISGMEISSLIIFLLDRLPYNTFYYMPLTQDNCSPIDKLPYTGKFIDYLSARLATVNT